MVRIPAGKRVLIKENGWRDLTFIPLVLEEDLQINLSSSFSAIYGGASGGLGDLLNMAGQAVGQATEGRIAFGSQFSQFGFQTWDSTDPISLSLNLGFYHGSTGRYNAKVEVYDPVMVLSKLPLPTRRSSGMLVAPGPSPLSLLESNDTGGGNSTFVTYSLSIGNVLNLSSVVFTRAQPIFSNEIDETGYPISGKIQLDVLSTETASQEMLEV